MSKTILVLAGALALAAPAAAQEATQAETPRFGFYGEFAVSAGDLAAVPVLTLKPAFELDFWQSGLTAGFEGEFPLPAEPAGGSARVYQEWLFDLSPRLATLTVGNENELAFGDPTVADGNAYLAFALQAGGVDIAALELDFGYAAASAWEPSFGLKPGVGYEFDFGDAGALGLWADFIVPLAPRAGLDGIEFDIAYTWTKDSLSLFVELEPALRFGDATTVEFEPSVGLGLSL